MDAAVPVILYVAVILLTLILHTTAHALAVLDGTMLNVRHTLLALKMDTKTVFRMAAYPALTIPEILLITLTLAAAVILPILLIPVAAVIPPILLIVVVDAIFPLLQLTAVDTINF